jgi:anti-sigma B factor antagonist
MSVEIDYTGDRAHLAVCGELTIYTVAEIKAALAEAMAGADELEVDLFGVTEVDSAGIQLMLIAKRNAGKRVVFTKHPAAVRRLIELASLGGALGDPMVIDAATP